VVDEPIPQKARHFDALPGLAFLQLPLKLLDFVDEHAVLGAVWAQLRIVRL
jgi:hypothetical protein